MADVPQRSGMSGETRLDPASTVELLGRARAGDRAALDRLFTRHAAPLRRWASGRLPQWARDLTDTDDLVQDTLLRTFKRIGEVDIREAGSLHAYLRQAVLNRIKDEFRRKGRRPDAAGFTGDEPDRTESPLEQAIGREMIERYERALARLKPDDQDAIIGRLELGYTYGELAESLGKPGAEAARKAAQRALVKLAEEMSRETR